MEPRLMRMDDVPPAAELLRSAFDGVYRRRGHAPPFPSAETAEWLCRAYLEMDPEGCIVVEHQGAVVGAGFCHVRGRVASIGPVAARPGAPAGVGRLLMRFIHRVTADCDSRRLFQDAFNPDSFALYSKLGYTVRDVAPYLITDRMLPENGRPPPAGIRRTTPDELGVLERFEQSQLGADRGRDLALLVRTGSGLVCVQDGEVAGYLLYRSLPARVVIGPAVAVSEEVMGDLLDTVAMSAPGRPAVLRASASNPSALQRALDRGFRIDHLGNLMVEGWYRAPRAQLYALFPESL